MSGELDRGQEVDQKSGKKIFVSGNCLFIVNVMFGATPVFSSLIVAYL